MYTIPWYILSKLVSVVRYRNINEYSLEQMRISFSRERKTCSKVTEFIYGRWKVTMML